MTARYLQRELCKELKNLFKEFLFKNSNGDDVGLNIYEQQLPIMQTGEEDPVPYAIVRIESGLTKTQTSVQEITVTVIFSCFDEGVENNGHHLILNMIQKLYERFERNPLLAEMFAYSSPFEWALQQEELYPYFFGAVSMTFHTLAIRREDALI